MFCVGAAVFLNDFPSVMPYAVFLSFIISGSGVAAIQDGAVK